MDRIPIYTALDGTVVFVSEGKKGPLDFRVSYKHPKKAGERTGYRTPKHIHIAIEILMMRQHDNRLTQELCNELQTIVENVHAPTAFPPSFQMFEQQRAEQFSSLNRYSELPVDLVFAIVELIAIQEKLGKGEAVRKLFNLIKDNASHFRIVGTATWRNQAVKR